MIDDAATSIAIVVLVPFVILIIGVLAIRRSRSRPALGMDTLAGRYNGEIRKLDGRPALFLRRPGFEAAMDFGADFGMSFRAKPDGEYPGHIQVSPEGVGAAVARFFGNEDIKIGDGEFDALYLVRGEPDVFVREALRADLRSLIRTLGRRGSVVLTVTPKSMQLRLGVFESTLDALDTFLACGLQIAEMLPRKASGEAIVFVDSKEAVESTSCQICGTPLSGEIVACSKCATLHHKECWDFNGRCSTFACGSLGSRKATLR